MANGYKVRLLSATSDGTNIYTEVEIYDGTKTLPLIYPTFKVGTAAATITAYLQQIADNAPTVADDIVAIVQKTVSGA